MTIFTASLLGFAITIGLILVLMPLARRIGLVDEAGGHKAHSGSVPLVGGIAMFCGFVFAMLAIAAPLGQFRALFAGGTLLVIVGVLDDFHHLPAWTRFVAQGIAALLMVLWGGVVVEDLGPLFSHEPVVLGWLAVPFTVFGVVGVINAVNMMDGLDGLAGGITALVLATLAGLCYAAGRPEAAGILLALFAVIAGFLLFNIRWPGQRTPSVFMGDAGSMFLGFVLAWFLVRLSQEPGRVIEPVTALWLLALPLLDTVTLIVHRLIHGQSPFHADRKHLHHALLARGLSTPATVITILTASLTIAVAGSIAQHLGAPPWLMFYTFAAVFALYFATMHRFWPR